MRAWFLSGCSHPVRVLGAATWGFCCLIQQLYVIMPSNDDGTLASSSLFDELIFFGAAPRPDGYGLAFPVTPLRRQDGMIFPLQPVAAVSAFFRRQLNGLNGEFTGTDGHDSSGESSPQLEQTDSDVFATQQEFIPLPQSPRAQRRENARIRQEEDRRRSLERRAARIAEHEALMREQAERRAARREARIKRAREEAIQQIDRSLAQRLEAINIGREQCMADLEASDTASHAAIVASFGAQERHAKEEHDASLASVEDEFRFQMSPANCSGFFCFDCKKYVVSEHECAVGVYSWASAVEGLYLFVSPLLEELLKSLVGLCVFKPFVCLVFGLVEYVLKDHSLPIHHTPALLFHIVSGFLPFYVALLLHCVFNLSCEFFFYWSPGMLHGNAGFQRSHNMRKDAHSSKAAHKRRDHVSHPSSFFFDWSVVEPSDRLDMAGKAFLPIKEGVCSCQEYLYGHHCPMQGNCPYDHPPRWMCPKSVLRCSTPSEVSVGTDTDESTEVEDFSLPSPATTLPAAQRQRVSDDHLSYVDVHPTHDHVRDGKYVKPSRVEGLPATPTTVRLYEYGFNILGVASGSHGVVLPFTTAWHAGYRSYQDVTVRQDLYEEQSLSVCGWKATENMLLGLQFNLGRSSDFLNTVSGDRVQALELYSRVVAQRNKLREVANRKFIRDNQDIPAGSLNWQGLPLFILASFASMMLRLLLTVISLIMDVSVLSTFAQNELLRGVPSWLILSGECLYGLSLLIALFSVCMSGTTLLYIALVLILLGMHPIAYSMTRLGLQLVSVFSAVSLLILILWSGVPKFVLVSYLRHPLIFGAMWCLVRQAKHIQNVLCVLKLGISSWRRGGSAISAARFPGLGNLVDSCRRILSRWSLGSPGRTGVSQSTSAQDVRLEVDSL